MRVRWATPADARSLARVWHASWHAAHGHLVPQQTLGLCTVQSFERRVGVALFEHDPSQPAPVPRPTALLAERGSDSSTTGFTVIRGGAEIEHLYVDVDAQGRGVGGRLLAAAEEVMHEERGCRVSHLVVAYRNQRAIQFYKRNAWVGTDPRLPWMSTAPWEAVWPPELPVPEALRAHVDARGSITALTDAELAATTIASCVSMKKWLGFPGWNPNDGEHRTF